MDTEKKRIELYMLSAARQAGVPIPTGGEPSEEPDFKFPTLGIETSEVLRPASTNYGIVPVEEESFHRAIMRLAQNSYYTVPNARPVHVNVYFTNTRGQKRSKNQMADELANFVKANSHRAFPVATFMHDEAPDGFDTITIIAEAGRDWWSGECGGVHLSDIRPQVEARIRAKNELVPAYRANLPNGAPLWLLFYMGVTVARSMPIPYGAEEWAIPFQFDRVFWFACLERQFVEIQRAQATFV